MAVGYFYPSPEINVGKPFLAEYMTSFLNQRKEDHREMIKAKLKALDPSTLIDLEQSHVRNIGKLQEQIARIRREGLAAQHRKDVATIKAEGAKEVQRIAAGRGLETAATNLIAKLYQQAMDGAAGFRGKHEPSRQDLATALTRIGKGPSEGDSNDYVTNLRSWIRQHAGEDVKAQWLAVKMIKVAEQRGHTAAVEQLKRNFPEYPALSASDPMAAFERMHPQMDPVKYAEDASASALKKIPRGQRQAALTIIKEQVSKDTKPTVSPGEDSALKGLTAMLGREMGELQRVRGERQRMQAEYKQTALGSYMKSWVSPSYVKEPEWQRDLEILGATGAQDRTVFDRFMEDMMDAETGGVDFDEYERLYDERYRRIPYTEEALTYHFEHGSAGNPVQVQYVHDLVERMHKNVLASGGRFDSPEVLADLEKIHVLVSADEGGKSLGASGAAIKRSIEKAFRQTGDWGTALVEMRNFAKRGMTSAGAQAEFEQEQQAFTHARKVAEQTAPNASMQDLINLRGLSAVFPEADATQADLDAISKLDDKRLGAFARRLLSQKEALNRDNDPTGRKVRRITNMMNWLGALGRERKAARASDEVSSRVLTRGDFDKGSWEAYTAGQRTAEDALTQSRDEEHVAKGILEGLERDLTLSGDPATLRQLTSKIETAKGKLGTASEARKRAQSALNEALQPGSGRAETALQAARAALTEQRATAVPSDPTVGSMAGSQAYVVSMLDKLGLLEDREKHMVKELGSGTGEYSESDFKTYRDRLKQGIGDLEKRGLLKEKLFGKSQDYTPAEVRTADIISGKAQTGTVVLGEPDPTERLPSPGEFVSPDE